MSIYQLTSTGHGPFEWSTSPGSEAWQSAETRKISLARQVRPARQPAPCSCLAHEGIVSGDSSGGADRIEKAFELLNFGAG